MGAHFSTCNIIIVENQNFVKCLEIQIPNFLFVLKSGGMLASGLRMTTKILQSTFTTLYEQDYYLWIETTLKQLQNQDRENLDWQHLAEEIEALGIEQRRKLESYLKQLLIHLLIYRYWQTEKEFCERGWKNEICNFRDELEFSCRSKTLYNYLLGCIDAVYFKARKQAIQKTGLSSDIFPEQCPFTVENILNSDYFPDEN